MQDPCRLETAQMIARSAQGDREAFAALYDATSPLLHAICRAILKDNPRAEKALEDSYVKIWHEAGRQEASGQVPMIWLITIARDVALARLDTADDGEAQANLKPGLGLLEGLTPVMPPLRARQRIREKLGHSAALFSEMPDIAPEPGKGGRLIWAVLALLALGALGMIFWPLLAEFAARLS